MKTLIISIILTFSSLNLISKTILVNNLSSSRDIWKSLQSAIEYANPGDTIFVMSSHINYGNIYIDKPLVIIGEGLGFNYEVNNTAKLTRVKFGHNLMNRTTSSNSVIKGFEFSYFSSERPNITTTNTRGSGLNNITLENNWVWFSEIYGITNNWTWENNVIRGLVKNLGLSYKNTFSNNIINDIDGFTNDDLFKNNLITGKIKNIERSIFIDNIIIDKYIFGDNIFNVDFYNNFFIYDININDILNVNFINNKFNSDISWNRYISKEKKIDYLINPNINKYLENNGSCGNDIGPYNNFPYIYYHFSKIKTNFNNIDYIWKLIY